MDPPVSPQTKRSPSLRVSFEKQPLRPALRKKSVSGSAASLLGAARGLDRKVIQPPKSDMAACFLQFCAMCEKQITTPSNSILYCSEACRRKDGRKPLSAASLGELTLPSSMSSSPQFTVLSPTSTGSYTHLPCTRIPPELHDHRPDLDPTEWKPKLPSHRTHSEAFRYLSQFHRSTNSTSTTSVSTMNDEINEMTSIPTSMPSLVSTSTPPTSVGIRTNTNSMTISSHQEPGHMQGSGYSHRQYQNVHANTYTNPGVDTSIGMTMTTSQSHGGSYDPSTRPLPTRHNRWYSFSGATPKGTDLVTPHIVPLESSYTTGNEKFDMRLNEEDTEGFWQKKQVISSGSPADFSARNSSGVGALFKKE